jgi:hypothetical protein
MAQEMKEENRMTEVCIAFARAVVRQSKKKQLVPADVGIALIAESLMLIHDIDAQRASGLVPHLVAYTHEILQAQIIEAFKGKCTEIELETLREKAARDHKNFTPVSRDAAAKAARRAELMGGAALPPNKNILQ